MSALTAVKPLRAALAGNPNSGKTSIFNALTGSRQRVGNYPGVTVEKRSGMARLNGRSLEIVDLPGTYGLAAFSMDEAVARDFLFDERPDVVINVVDASNLERNLGLTIQLLEMGAPLVVALNMSDDARRAGLRIDIEKLSSALNAPVVPTVGNRGEGVRELLAATAQVAERREGWTPSRLSYGAALDAEIERMQASLEESRLHADESARRWFAIKCLEQDEAILKRARADGAAGRSLLEAVSAHARRMQCSESPSDTARLLSDARYRLATEIFRRAVHSKSASGPTLSDRIDRFAIHPLAGWAILLAVFYAAFKFTFTVSDAPLLAWAGISGTPVSWIESAIVAIGAGASAILPEGLLESLAVDGILGGVGGVLSFVPLIFLMFIVIAIIEDSGYLGRVAFLLDRCLRMFGLQGRSVLAMAISGGVAGGCAVPGVMATRTLRDPRERLATMLVCPLLNCGAKLPVYGMLIAAFFSRYETLMMLALTFLSWGLALSAAFVLRNLIVRGPQDPLVLELPPYRMPTLKSVCFQSWGRTKQYIKKAGTFILAASILMWALLTFPRLPEESAAAYADPAELAHAELEYSIAGRLGHALKFVMDPIGVDWRGSVALIGGVAAKEVIVATMGAAYSLGDVDPEAAGSLTSQLAADPAWSPLSAFAFIVFVMLYAPCISTVAVIVQETRSWKWGAFATAYSTLLGWGLAFGIFQIGSALGIGV